MVNGDGVITVADPIWDSQGFVEVSASALDKAANVVVLGTDSRPLVELILYDAATKEVIANRTDLNYLEYGFVSTVTSDGTNAYFGFDSGLIVRTGIRSLTETGRINMTALYPKNNWNLKYSFTSDKLQCGFWFSQDSAVRVNLQTFTVMDTTSLGRSDLAGVLWDETGARMFLSFTSGLLQAPHHQFHHTRKYFEDGHPLAGTRGVMGWGGRRGGEKARDGPALMGLPAMPHRPHDFASHPHPPTVPSHPTHPVPPFPLDVHAPHPHPHLHDHHPSGEDKNHGGPFPLDAHAPHPHPHLHASAENSDHPHPHHMNEGFLPLDAHAPHPHPHLHDSSAEDKGHPHPHHMNEGFSSVGDQPSHPHPHPHDPHPNGENNDYPHPHHMNEGFFNGQPRHDEGKIGMPHFVPPPPPPTPPMTGKAEQAPPPPAGCMEYRPPVDQTPRKGLATNDNENVLMAVSPGWAVLNQRDITCPGRIVASTEIWAAGSATGYALLRCQYLPHSLATIDLGALEISASWRFPGGSAPSNVVVDAANNRVYTAEYSTLTYQHQVAQYNLTNGDPLATSPSGRDALLMPSWKEGRLLAAYNDAGSLIHVAETATPSVAFNAPPLYAGFSVSDKFVVDPTTHQGYMAVSLFAGWAGPDTFEWHLVRMDLTTGIVSRQHVVLGSECESLEMDVATGVVYARVGTQLLGVPTRADTFAVTSNITLTNIMSAPVLPVLMYFDGGVLFYATSDNHLVKMSLDGTQLNSLPAGNPIFSLAFEPTSRTIYVSTVSQQTGGHILVVDVDVLAEIATYPKSDGVTLLRVYGDDSLIVAADSYNPRTVALFSERKEKAKLAMDAPTIVFADGDVLLLCDMFSCTAFNKTSFTPDLTRRPFQLPFEMDAWAKHSDVASHSLYAVGASDLEITEPVRLVTVKWEPQAERSVDWSRTASSPVPSVCWETCQVPLHLYDWQGKEVACTEEGRTILTAYTMDTSSHASFLWTCASAMWILSVGAVRITAEGTYHVAISAAGHVFVNQSLTLTFPQSSMKSLSPTGCALSDQPLVTITGAFTEHPYERYNYRVQFGNETFEVLSANSTATQLLVRRVNTTHFNGTVDVVLYQHNALAATLPAAFTFGWVPPTPTPTPTPRPSGIAPTTWMAAIGAGAAGLCGLGALISLCILLIRRRRRTHGYQPIASGSAEEAEKGQVTAATEEVKA